MLIEIPAIDNKTGNSLSTSERWAPLVHPTAFIAPDAQVIGNVILEEDTTILFGVVLRGDLLQIKVGARSNIQEHSCLHTSHGRTPTIIASDVTVGHRVIVHGATISSRVIVGMGSIILDEAVIGEDSIVGAGSLITEGKKFPPRSLILGSPAKVVRELSDEELKYIKFSVESYVKTGRMYKKELGI